MKTNELNRQQIDRDVERYLQASGAVDQIPFGVSAEKAHPLRRSKSEHIKHLKHSDPTHPLHND